MSDSLQPSPDCCPSSDPSTTSSKPLSSPRATSYHQPGLGLAHFEAGNHGHAKHHEALNFLGKDDPRRPTFPELTVTENTPANAITGPIDPRLRPKTVESRRERTLLAGRFFQPFSAKRSTPSHRLKHLKISFVESSHREPGAWRKSILLKSKVHARRKKPGRGKRPDPTKAVQNHRQEAASARQNDQNLNFKDKQASSRARTSS